MSLLMMERNIIVIAGHIGLVIDVNVSVYEYRRFDVTAAMFVYQNKRILIRFFCDVHEYVRCLLSCFSPKRRSGNDLLNRKRKTNFLEI